MKHRLRMLSSLCKIAVQCACTAAGLTVAVHGQAPLKITAPPTGATVNPGQTVSVHVAVEAGNSLSEMVVIGETPIGFSQALTSSPYQFMLSIPSSIRAGFYSLVASAIGPFAGDLESDPILIDVEPNGTISSLHVEPTTIQFGFVGEQMPVRVIGMIGALMDITESSKVSYSSQDAGVAAVSTTGIITATGGGNTTIFVSASGIQASVPVSVPPALRGDLNGDGKVDQDDLNVILPALNTPATKPADARDLNRDGSINALDSRILVTLCSRPDCATH